MVDISSDLKSSFEILKHHKKIVIPTLLSVVIPFILIIIFLNISGISPLIKEISSLKSEFDSAKEDYLLNPSNFNNSNYPKELINYISQDADNSDYNKEFGAYLEKQGYDWVKFMKLVNFNNVILLILFVSLSMLSSFYLTCMNYSILALAMKNQDIGLNNVVRLTNHFLTKLFSIQLLFFAIVLAPIMIFLIIAGSLFFVSPFFGGVFIFIFTLLLIAYFFFIGIRTAFAYASMYLDDEGPIKSVQHSFVVTKHHLGQVLIIFLIIYAINIFVNGFISEPIQLSFSNLIIGDMDYKIVFSTLILIIFIIIESAILTYENLFVFASYIDLKKLEEVNK